MKYEYQVKSAEYQLKDVDRSGTVIIRPNAFGNVDDQGDISMPGAFAKTNKEGFARLRYLFNHSMTRKVGEPLEGWEDSEGWVVKAVLNLNKEDGRNTYEDYRLAAEYGRGVEHSMGAWAIKTDGKALNRDNPMSDPRKVYEWYVGEISYVPFRGSNPNTPVLALKSSCDVRFLDYCIKNGNYTDDYFVFLQALQAKAAEMHFPREEAANDEAHQFLTLIQI